MENGCLSMVNYGHALPNGIVLGNDRGEVRTVIKRGVICSHYNRKHGSKLYHDFIKKIPLVRGLFNLCRNTGIFFGSAFLFLFEIASPMLGLHDSPLSVALSVAFLIAFIFHNKFSLQYHACEHMVANAYESGIPLVLENVKECSRVHQNCGTNWAVCIIPFMAIGIWIFSYWSIALVVAWIITYEIDEFKTLSAVIKRLGAVVQENITTQRPTDDQIRLAIKCLECLIENTETSALLPNEGLSGGR